MTKTIVEIKGVSKKYKIQRPESYVTLRDKISDFLKKPSILFKNLKKIISNDSVFWALNDITLDIRKGETLGIIGKNGAGKTTLLKVLSRITSPTMGHIKLYGRVASLLEVGTGFHPELSGRENIYFNGSILGMKKKEIDNKFDEIVDFADVHEFIDTPIKRYSSGMQVKLAFSVAAHLEPEILLIDEVLSVGDIAFQKKSLGRMEKIVNEGRTVIFVSHNLGAVQRLCTRTILLDQGSIVMNGPTDKVIAKYAGNSTGQMGQQEWTNDTAPGNEVVRILSIKVLDKNENISVHFDVRDPITIEIQYKVLKSIEPQCVTFVFHNELERPIFISRDNSYSPWSCVNNPLGIYKSSCFIPPDFLNHGMISVAIIVEPMDAIRRYPRPLVKDAVVFYVGDKMNPEGTRGNYPFEWESYVSVRPRLHWTVKKIQ